MKEISIVGLDLAKRVFQVHGVDQNGQVVVQKRLTRSELLVWFGKLNPCLVGMEACATAHYWARELGRLGHQVRLIPPAYVKPYVRRQKNDRTDAAAICEAVGRPSMRFATAKTIKQQAVQMLHRSRELLIQQRTQLTNALRAHLAELGLIFPLGDVGMAKAIAAVQEKDNDDIPAFIQQVLFSLIEQIKNLKKEITGLDKQMIAWHRAHTDSQRLATIPGVGVVTASAIIAAIGDGRQFHSGREFAAWMGLVPRQNSSGGKEQLGHISKKGNVYLRQLLVLGATSQLRGKNRDNAPGGKWFNQLLQRKPARVATVALANKTARIVWAVLIRGECYRTPIVANPAVSIMAAAM
jgi:transposase